MRLARVLGAIGRALISAGVIVLLFVGYQLWGTGLQHSQAQDSLEDDFLSVLDSDLAAEAQAINEIARGDDPDDTPADSGDAGDSSSDATDDGADDTDGVSPGDDDAGDDPGESDNATLIDTNLDDIEYSPEFISALYPEPGKSLARIVIPDINVDQIIVEGVSVEDLRKGPGHYPSTPNPGQAGNASVAGHRTTYGAPFHRVDELKPGALITVVTLQGTFEYRVTANDNPSGGEPLGHFIVSPSDTWVLNQDDRNLLTLTACHPKYSARQRIIVQAELVGEPAPTIPRDEADDLAPLQLDAGAEDEARGSEIAEGSDLDQVIGDDVAQDDDPELTDDPAFNDDETEVAAGSDAVDGDSDAAPTGDDGDSTSDADASDGSPANDDATAPSGEGADESAAVDVTSDDVELTNSETPFDPDFGEGLNGDRTKIKPAIMWGLAGGSIWLAAWFIGRRLNRKWTLYAVGVIAFTPVLWSCFVNIDQALPSY